MLYLIISSTLILGILLGWFTREIRDILKGTVNEIRKVKEQGNRHARGGVITGGVAYSQGKPLVLDDKPIDDVVVLPDYQEVPLPKPASAVVRPPSPRDVKARQEKEHKDAMARG